MTYETGLRLEALDRALKTGSMVKEAIIERAGLYEDYLRNGIVKTDNPETEEKNPSLPEGAVAITSDTYLMGNVIVYKDQEYFKPCGEQVGYSSFCVKMMNHPNAWHEDKHGNLSPNLKGMIK